MSQTAAAITVETETAARVARAAEHIGATKLADGRWAHYADETGRWYVVSEDELAELCDYLDDEDEQVSRDAYSHWCAGTVAKEIETDSDEYEELTGKRRCSCGRWSGESCSAIVPRDEMVEIEVMPEHLRASHEAAGNSGSYPHNGAMRLLVSRECADMILEHDSEWASEVQS